MTNLIPSTQLRLFLFSLNFCFNNFISDNLLSNLIERVTQLSECLAKRLDFYFFRRLGDLRTRQFIIWSLFIPQKETLSLWTLIIIVENGWLWVIVVQTVLMILMATVVVIIVSLPHITPHQLGCIL